MPRYELSISPSYVPDWGLTEATRELFQNAMDQETIDETNKMALTYDNHCLSISSTLSTLSKSSLLLGTSSKADDANTIGKFGEGYKLALLVLTRLGYKVEVLNYASKERWVPKIIKSRRYDSDLLVIDVEKFRFTKVPNSNLTFNIYGVTTKNYELIQSKTLFLQPHYEKLESEDFEVLLDEAYKGFIFVSGLFVCKCRDKTIKYGYNVPPNRLKLDRDRALVDSFNLQWMTSQLWTKYEDKDFVARLVKDGIGDVKYVNMHSTSYGELNEVVFNLFQSEHGPTSVPVHNETQKRIVRQNHPALKPIITDENTYSLVTRSTSYSYMLKSCKVVIVTPQDELQKFFIKHSKEFTEDMTDEFKKIIDKSKDWS